MTFNAGRAQGAAARVIGSLLVFAALAGCGARTAPGTDRTETGLVAAEVRAVPDRASNPKSFRELFADAAAAPEPQRKHYAKYQIEPVGAARIEGENATVAVRIYDDREGKEIGRVTWTLVKQGDKWKLKTAPLP